MAKRSFLSPVALSATMILGGHAQATVLVESANQPQAKLAEAGTVPADLGYGEVLDRSSGTDVILAYHSSHASHASHGSHCSGYSYC